MRIKKLKSVRWLVLAVFVLVSGFCYSCGLGQQAGPAVLAQAETASLDVSMTEYEEPAVPASDMDSAALCEPAEQESGAVCYVYVCGEVAVPGVYQMEEGQRIYEAVELAGGFTGEAADTFLNLAERISDGMKIIVPDQEQAAQPAAGSMTGAGTDISGQQEVSGKVDLNTATREELMTLRGIGEARAEDILTYRSQHGAFHTIEEIMQVPGIKAAAFDKIKDDIIVGRR